jgi:predicted PurR-regulated permease PerM
MPSNKNSHPSGLLIAIVAIAALYLAKIVFIPLALALLFSLLLTPVVSFLERLKLPRILAILSVVLILMGLAGFLGWKSSRQLVNISEQLPTYRNTLEQKIRLLRDLEGDSLNRATDTVHQLEKDVVAATPGAPIDKSHSAPGSSPSRPLAVEVVPPTNPLEVVENMLGPLVAAGVIAIFTIFILIGREDLRNRFIKLAGGGRLSAMTQALDDATRRINRYLLLQLAVNVGYGVLIGIALHFIGVPNAWLWGLCAGILRFLPYIGPPMAAVMPILLSLALFSGWGHALIIMGVFFALELIVSNFIEPLLYGTHVGLSPLAILVAAIFWTLVWGLPGLILSTPLTVCLVVMGRYVPSLNFLNVLLGDEPPLAPHVEYYQRLLAADQNQARELLELHLKEKSLEELYDSLVIPALSLSEEDRHRNMIDEPTQKLIYQSTREIIEELGDLPGELSGDEGVEHPSAPFENQNEHAEVLCIPARDEADDVVASLLAQLLRRRGIPAKSVSIGTTAEMLAQVGEANPDMVCISALPPFALNHARALYAKLRADSPRLHVIICLWHAGGDALTTAGRLRLAEGHGFFTRIPEVLQHVVFRAQAGSSLANHV